MFRGSDEVYPNFCIVDYNYDNYFDLILRTSRRSISFYENLALDSLQFSIPQEYGQINVRSNAYPFLFDYQNNDTLDLIISYNILDRHDLFCYALIESFENNNGYFNFINPIKQNAMFCKRC